MSVDGPLSDRSLAGLRCTAAALVALPTLRARLVHDDRTILAVRRPPFDGPDGTDGTDGPGHPVLPPCAFRGAVARAHALRRSGERLALRGVPQGAEPSIQWGVAPGDLALPGSMVRVCLREAWCHVAAVAAPLDVCRRAVVGDDGGPPGLGFHADAALDTTLLYLATPTDDLESSAEAVAALQIAVARVSVAELIEHLDAVVPDTPARLM